MNNTSKPNIIIIVVDGMRRDRRHVHPIFDKLAKEATLFTNVVAYAPYTMAALHSLLTGEYGSRTGVNAYYSAEKFKSDKFKTLQEYLKNYGYATYADTFRKGVIPKSGFDSISYYDERKEDLVKRHTSLLEGMPRTSPYFLFLHYINIHTNIVRALGWRERMLKWLKLSPEVLFRMILNYDKSIYRAGSYLKSIYRPLENTIWVILSDHGCSLGEKDGERIYGTYLYDYTLRTFVYFIGGKFPKGVIRNNCVRSIDVMPTILDILNIPLRDSREGKSLAPDISAEAPPDRPAFSETGGLTGPNPSPYEPNIKSIIKEEWKLIYNLTTKQRELYNTREDKAEEKNLAGRYPSLEKGLFEMLDIENKKS